MASRNRTLSFLVILSALMAFTSLSTDIYLPALASVEKTVGGAAAALIGALQYGSGIVSSLLLAAFSDGTQRAMTGLIALFVGLSALMAMGGRRVVV